MANIYDLIANPQVPNIDLSFMQGQDQGAQMARQRNRLLALRQAGQLASSGQGTEAINRLIGSGYGEDAAPYIQLQRYSQAAEQDKTQNAFRERELAIQEASAKRLAEQGDLIEVGGRVVRRSTGEVVYAPPDPFANLDASAGATGAPPASGVPVLPPGANGPRIASTSTPAPPGGAPESYSLLPANADVPAAAAYGAPGPATVPQAAAQARTAAVTQPSAGPRQLTPEQIADIRAGGLISREEGLKRLDAYRNPKPPDTFVTDIGGRRLLKEKQSGATISDMGPSPTSKSQAIPAQTASQIGLAEEFLKTYPDLVKKIKSTPEKTGVFSGVGLSGNSGLIGLVARSGDAGTAYRDIVAGSEAMSRMLTGAGMTIGEVQRETDQYLPAWNDSETTILSKLDRLQSRLKGMIKKVYEGRGTVDELVSTGDGSQGQSGGTSGTTSTDVQWSW